AMQRLTQEGLLVSVRNRGVFVIEVTDDDVRDMYLARTALERAAAAHAAETDPAAAQEQLLRIVQEMEDAAGRGDLVAVTEADIDFHTTLVSLAHSPRLTRMHTTLMVETRMCITALEHRYSSQSPRLQEHRHIAEAIGRADLAGLDRQLVGHMEDAIGRLVAALD
ncbi:MAG: GntR family transcriptional regulator, partial [Micrococcales bacterium]|nr:GntR family transcriptional regulator [Micrococcales bacterium]